MSILGDIPQSRTQRVFQSLGHFVLGAFFGLFPSLLVFAAVSMAPDANGMDVICVLLLIFCIPPGLVFMILGLMGRGKLIAGMLRWLGRRVDPNSH
jgi:hypothetical protein